MCRTLLKYTCYLILALVASIFLLLGWCATTPVPEGTFFATVIPLYQGQLPQTIFGSTVQPLTPPVPADMAPLPRPQNEKFTTLAGTGD